MISPLAHVDPSAKIAGNVTIHPFAFIDKDVEIGEGCTIYPYASVLRGTRMGKSCRVFQGAVVGVEPQDFRWKGGFTYCHIGDNVTIREHVIINRGIRPETQGTEIGPETFIMANSHIGHDTVVKGKSVLGNGVTIAGDCEIDQCVILSSNVIIHEKARIGKWVIVKGGCRISGNVPPYIIAAHNPIQYFGVNATVMGKHGFTPDQINDIAKAYRNVYQSNISVFNALRRIENDLAPSEIREEITGFIRHNNLRIVGVPLEMTD